MTKPEIRFNGGRGAVTCEKCQVIVDQNFSRDDWRAITRVNVPCYCRECDPEKSRIFSEAFFKELTKEQESN